MVRFRRFHLLRRVFTSQSLSLLGPLPRLLSQSPQPRTCQEVEVRRKGPTPASSEAAVHFLHRPEKRMSWTTHLNKQGEDFPSACFADKDLGWYRPSHVKRSTAQTFALHKDLQQTLPNCTANTALVISSTISCGSKGIGGRQIPARHPLGVRLQMNCNQSSHVT